MLTACDSESGKKDSSSKKISIVATIYPQYDWIKNILGERADSVDLKLLIKNGTDLHSYKPSAQDIATIAKADLVVYVGGESDEWIEKALAATPKDGRIALNLMKALGDHVKKEEIVEGMQAEEHEHAEKHEDEHHEHAEGHHHHDEEEEMEEKVECVIKKHHAHLLQTAKDNYSPLCNLTPEQEERVKQLLCNLPSNPKNPDYIYLAQVANHLKALEQLDKARLGDVYALQSWVERVTGKRTPEYRQFNEAILHAKESKITKAREVIERILQ